MIVENAKRIAIVNHKGNTEKRKHVYQTRRLRKLFWEGSKLTWEDDGVPASYLIIFDLTEKMSRI